MRLVLLVALLLVPAAAAASLPVTGEKTYGPCRVAWNLDSGGGFVTWPTYEVVECRAAGEEIVFVGEGYDWGGHWCAVRVAGVPLFECPV